MAISDITIVGSGVMGMGIARGLLEIDPGLRISILEKDLEFSAHASLRNSGVLHAGFYYSPESMKARFCRDGRDMLEALITDHAIPFQKIGKVVVTQNEEEEERLDGLLERGIANGVKLERRNKSELSGIEPLAQTYKSFLWSPNTSISSPKLVNTALRNQLIMKGVSFLAGSNVTTIDGSWYCNGKRIESRFFVNAAGARALEISKGLGVGNQFRTMPFLGLYKQTQSIKLPIRTLIYPVPHTINPFLGVHLTPTISGHVKIGPSALPIIGREQYAGVSQFNFTELLNFGRNLISLGKGNKRNLLSILNQEIKLLSTNNLVSAASRLVPAAATISSWEKTSPGIRGQLVDTHNGELVQDFIVEYGENSVHVLNAVSPGWTASLSFGRFIAKQLFQNLK
jgi:L-2-hydroxyglutarate oxidase LhgO